MLNELAKDIHRTAVEKGWWGDLSDYRPDRPGGHNYARNFGEILCLIHSEVSEALEEYRDGHPLTEIRHEATGHPEVAPETGVLYGWKPEGVPVEMADIIIRVLDACAALGIDIDRALQLKTEFNKTRPHKHGGKIA